MNLGHARQITVLYRLGACSWSNFHQHLSQVLLCMNCPLNCWHIHSCVAGFRGPDACECRSRGVRDSGTQLQVETYIYAPAPEKQPGFGEMYWFIRGFFRRLVTNFRYFIHWIHSVLDIVVPATSTINRRNNTTWTLCSPATVRIIYLCPRPVFVHPMQASVLQNSSSISQFRRMQSWVRHTLCTDT